MRVLETAPHKETFIDCFRNAGRTTAIRPERENLLTQAAFKTGTSGVRIPLFREEADQASERSDAGTSMLPGLIGIVKWNLAGARIALRPENEDHLNFRIAKRSDRRTGT
jgi:hypothetical protein